MATRKPLVLIAGQKSEMQAGDTIDPALISNPGSGWTTLTKTADQAVINNATLQTDATLSFSMAASTKYRIRGVCFIDTTAAADYKYAFAGPASPTLVRFSRIDAVPGAAPAIRAIDIAMPAATSITGTGTTGGYVSFDIIFHNGANAAAFAFQWAQNTATADTGAILRAGSYMEYSVI
jgi:hypothetical protein